MECNLACGKRRPSGKDFLKNIIESGAQANSPPMRQSQRQAQYGTAGQFGKNRRALKKKIIGRMHYSPTMRDFEGYPQGFSLWQLTPNGLLHP